MNIADEVLDAPITTEIAPLAPLDKIKAGLTELASQAITFDLATTAGEKAARALRAKCVSLRTSTDDAYETINRPILQTQRDARALRDTIKAEVLKIETPLDVAIKALEAEKEAAKKAKEEAERQRVEAIQERIAEIRGAVNACAHAGSALIAEHIGDVGRITIDGSFDEYATAAQRAKDETLAKLAEMRGAAKAREEAEAARLAQFEAQRIENERIKAEQEAERARLKAEADRIAEERRKADAERAEQDRIAREARQAEERAAREAAAAEQARIDEQRAALRREQDEADARRRAEAQAEQERLDAIAKAERERLAAEQAEADRKAAEARAAADREAAEKRAAEDAERAAAAARLGRMQARAEDAFDFLARIAGAVTLVEAHQLASQALALIAEE